jgi:hypothetical protein
MITRSLASAFIIFALLSTSYCHASIERHYSFEIDYGAATTNLLLPNDKGQDIYGDTLYTNPVGFTAIWSAAKKMNIGISYLTSTFLKEKYYFFDGDVIKDPSIKFTSITPFFDLGPYVFEKDGPSGITDGFFVEVGPSFLTVTEAYKLNGSDHAFSTSGLFLELRVGFRTLHKEPLSFVFRTKALIPISSDSRSSDTGFSLNGLSTFSLNAGFCLTL